MDLWAFVIIGGPILLAAVLLWARLNNRQTPKERRRTEAATRHLYADEARSDAARDRGEEP